jgi:hypothetical protein
VGSELLELSFVRWSDITLAAAEMQFSLQNDRMNQEIWFNDFMCWKNCHD